MTVSDIRKLYEDYRKGNLCSMDSISYSVIKAYKRGRLTEVDTLLKYIDAVCVSSGRSAHLLFLELMNQKNPTMDGWSNNHFYISPKYSKYTDHLYSLYLLDSTGDGNIFLSNLNLNVYTPLLYIGSDVYYVRKSNRVYSIPEDVSTYAKYLFGSNYIVPVCMPKDLTSLELSYLVKNYTKLAFESGEDLCSVVHRCTDFKPMSNGCITDYSLTHSPLGVTISLVLLKGTPIEDLNIPMLLEDLNLQYYSIKQVSKIDDYRASIFITK